MLEMKHGTSCVEKKKKNQWKYRMWAESSNNFCVFGNIIYVQKNCLEKFNINSTTRWILIYFNIYKDNTK